MTIMMGQIAGITFSTLCRFNDDRGWLTELFREDELDSSVMPKMSYISFTRPGVTRGPHEHLKQTDIFYFPGPSNFEIHTWDNREDSPTFGVKEVFIAGEYYPAMLIVPKGVVHAYKNIGEVDGLVINCPNKLFRGTGKREEIDEIRYENCLDTKFKM